MYVNVSLLQEPAKKDPTLLSGSPYTTSTLENVNTIKDWCVMLKESVCQFSLLQEPAKNRSQPLSRLLVYSA